MNIAFGFDIFYPETNGVITASLNLAENLIKKGHTVYFYVPYDKAFKDDIIGNGIHVIHVPAIRTYIYPGIKFSPTHSRMMLRTLQEYHIDVVHTTSTWLICIALAHAAHHLGIPVVATHHTLIDNPDYIQYALKNYKLSVAAQKIVWITMFSPYYKYTDVITAPSRNTCKQLKHHLHKKDIRYISNGIDTNRFTDQREGCAIPASIPAQFVSRETLVFVGRQGYEKSIDVVLKAFALLLVQKPHAKLLIIGKGPAATDLKNLAGNLGLTDQQVCFTGVIPNAELIGSHVLAKLGAFVSASLTENQAMTIIEALCSGCPVIIPDQANMTDLVSESTGWIFKQKDVADLAKKMNEALSDETLRAQKGEQARENISRFDGNNVTDEFIKLYEEMQARKLNNMGNTVDQAEQENPT